MTRNHQIVMNQDLSTPQLVVARARAERMTRFERGKTITSVTAEIPSSSLLISRKNHRGRGVTCGACRRESLAMAQILMLVNLVAVKEKNQ